MIFETLYFALPGLVANMAPILVKNHFKPLAFPIDRGLRLKGKPILGTHKTFRGFVFGILAAILVALCQRMLYVNGLLRSWSYVDYGETSFIYIGVALGLGALVGDSVKSFFKRRFGVKEGDRFFPWDQIDYTLGISAFAFLIKPLTLLMLFELLVAGLLLHIITTRIGYFTGLRKEKW
jgi:CDP-2,3-bis-(O-geranylgeranyl)-sn-glycerol synthase